MRSDLVEDVGPGLVHGAVSAMMALPFRVGWAVIWRLGVLLAGLMVGRVPQEAVGAAIGILLLGGLVGIWAKVGLLPSLYRILGAISLPYLASAYFPSRLLILWYTAALIVIVIDIWWTMSAPLFRETAKELEPQVSHAASTTGPATLAMSTHEQQGRTWVAAMTSLTWLTIAVLGVGTIAGVWHVRVSLTEDGLALVREGAARVQELATRLLSIILSS